MSNHGPHHDYTVSGDAMRWTDQPGSHDLADLYGEPIHTYSRANAIADGALIDATRAARTCGFVFPVAVTSAVWADCVAFDNHDREVTGRSFTEVRRLLDVLVAAAGAIRRTPSHLTDRTDFTLVSVPRAGADRLDVVTLTAVCGPGDDGDPVIMICQPNED